LTRCRHLPPGQRHAANLRDVIYVLHGVSCITSICFLRLTIQLGGTASCGRTSEWIG